MFSCFILKSKRIYKKNKCLVLILSANKMKIKHPILFYFNSLWLKYKIVFEVFYTADLNKKRTEEKKARISFNEVFSFGLLRPQVIICIYI